jgi:uncharacterized protein YfaQ (DUF2300 family)
VRRQRKVCATVASAAAIAMLTGCGSDSARKPTARSATASIVDVCEAAAHEIVGIDDKLTIAKQLEIQAPKPKIAKQTVFEGLFQQAAMEAQKLDNTTAAKVRRLPATSHTPVALADLPRDRTQLRVIVRTAHGRSLASNRSQHGLFAAFIKANGGCGHVGATKPVLG